MRIAILKCIGVNIYIIFVFFLLIFVKTRAQCWCTNQIGIVLSDMKKILVIDDNLLNLKLIFDVLKTDFPNYQIILSQSGIEGIEIAQRELPDIILLDILMPGMDGFEVCNILKNDKTTNHIPILMVSAMNELSFRVKGLNTGADAFISKPFDNAELKAQIKVLLRIKFAEDLLRKRNENLEILIKKQTSEFQDIKVRYSKVTEYILEYFWEVDPKGQQALANLAEVLGQNPDINVLVEGHTDDVPMRGAGSVKDN